MLKARPVRICEVHYHDCYIYCHRCGATLSGCTPEDVAVLAAREGWKYIPLWDTTLCPRCWDKYGEKYLNQPEEEEQ